MRTNLGTKNGNPDTDVARRLDRLERQIQGIPSRFGGGGRGSGNAIVQTGIIQTGHGFSVGTIVYQNASGWHASKSDVITTALVTGMVSNVQDVNTFDLTLCGTVTGLIGITPGTLYYLSDTAAGGFINAPPNNRAHFNVPVFWADPTTANQAYLINGRSLGSDLNAIRSPTIHAEWAAGEYLDVSGVSTGVITIALHGGTTITIDPADLTAAGATGQALKLQKWAVCDPVSGTIKNAVFLSGPAF